MPGAAGTGVGMEREEREGDPSMTSHQHAAPAVAQTTGTKDKIYNLVRVLYHALQGADTCRQYIQDAPRCGTIVS